MYAIKVNASTDNTEEESRGEHGDQLHRCVFTHDSVPPLAPAQLYGSQLRTVLELPHGNAQVSLKLPQKWRESASQQLKHIWLQGDCHDLRMIAELLARHCWQRKRCTSVYFLTLNVLKTGFQTVGHYSTRECHEHPPSNTIATASGKTARQIIGLKNTHKLKDMTACGLG